MQSRTTAKFRKLLSKLPEQVQDQARQSFHLWTDNPSHPSLHFKKIHSGKPYYSARINLDYRVIGVKRDSGMVWFWVGHHDEYERVISQL